MHIVVTDVMWSSRGKGKNPVSDLLLNCRLGPGARQPAPMLAISGELPGDAGTDAEPKWAYEFKWDGVRALVAIHDGRFRAWGRGEVDTTVRYPELQRLTDAMKSRQLLFDGELVAFDAAGRPSFGALQRRMHLSDPAEIARMVAQVPVTYLIFDLLHVDGRSLLCEPYRQRRGLLESLVPAGSDWVVPPYYSGGAVDGSEQGASGIAVQQASRDQALEGVVAKRLDSPYRSGKRSSDWIKVPNVLTQEVVIGGWREGTGRLEGQLGALLLGVLDPEPGSAAGRTVGQGLSYIGDVGTGFSETVRADLIRLLRSRERKTSPFATPIPAGRARGARWVNPTLVGEVRFRSWTVDGRLRHASWRGLRSDKRPTQVHREHRTHTVRGL